MLKASQLTLRFKLNAAILAAFLLLTSLVAAILLPFLEREVQDSRQRARSLLLVLARHERERLANEIFEGRISAVRLRLQQTLDAEDVVGAAAYDAAGRPLVHVGGESPELRRLPEQLRQHAAKEPVFLMRRRGGAPLLTLLTVAAAMGESTGFMALDYSLEREDQLRRHALFTGSALLLAILLILTVFLNYLLSRTIISPMVTMGRSMETIAGGDLDSRVPVEVDDEMGRLGRSFNHMADRIREQQQGLRAAEQKYRGIFENAVEGIFQTSPQGVVIAANKSLADFLGFASVATLTASGLSLVDDLPCHAHEREELLRLIARHGSVSGLVMEIRRRDGSCRRGSLSLRNVPAPKGGLPHYEGAIVDMTLQEEKEQAERQRLAAETRAKAKSAFLANMSHEIRTPMNAIIGMSHLALQAGLPAQQHEYVANINKAAKTLLTIINDILDYSKVDAGKLQLASSEFYLDEVLAQVAAMVMLQAEEKDIEVVFQVQPGIPHLYAGDALRLGQVCVNLLGNAVKFTRKGLVALRISLQEQRQGHALLRFTVQDTGIGMSAQQVERLFTPFSQADESTTREFGGTGLGLSICKSLVELMQGSIWAESTPGQGSTFRFTALLGLPPQEFEQPPLPHGLEGGNALLLAPETSSREALALAVQELGLRPVTAGSPAQAAQEAAADAPFHVAFLDTLLARNAQGLELQAASLRAANLLAPETRCILLTPTYARRWQQNAARRLGAAMLDRPFTRSSLRQCLSESESLDTTAPARQGPTTPAWPAEPPPASAARPALGGKRILLAEDNAVNRQLVQTLLDKAGAVVDHAENGVQAVEAVRSREYDLLLMDVQMPVMDGIQATRAIRELRAEDAGHTRRLPIIAMTAHAMDEDRRLCLEAGMDDHLPKPLEPKKFLDTLQRWLAPDATTAPAAGEAAPPPDPGPEAGPADNPGAEAVCSLDTARGLDLVDGDEEAYRLLLTTFHAEYAPQGDLLRHVVQEGEPDALLEVRRTLHGIKGAAGNVGAVELSRAARELESQIAAGDVRRETRQHFLACFEAVMAELQRRGQPAAGSG